MKVKQTIKEFYDNQAEKFSQTRTKIWPEFNYIAQEVEKLLVWKDKIKILELGCGDGRLCRFLAEKFPGKIEYIWVDISEGLIRIAKKLSENYQINSQISFIVSDMLDYLENVEPETFDFIVAVASFQHIPTRWERLLILKHIYRILKYGGEVMMFNWSFSKWFFKKYKWQVLKSFILGVLSLWTKAINDIMVPWKTESKTFYRYYHIFFLFELKKLFKQAWFVIKEACYINKRGEKTISRMDSRNSCIVWIKKIINS